MVQRYFTCLIFILILGICSCKKETPADYPVVTISAPYSNEIFTVLNSINVQARVSDGQQLVSVTIYVANSQNVPVLASAQIPVTSNSMDINVNYNLSDIHMNSGTYYVVVSAFNGTNTTDAFQEISVNAVPTKRTAIYAITSTGGLHVWKIDSAFNSSLSYSVSGDYSSFDINSYYQQLYTTGFSSGSASVYSVASSNVAWSVSGVNPPPYFTNVYCCSDAAYISFYQGYIKYYNYKGALQVTYNTLSGYYPVNTFVWDGYLFATEKCISSDIADLAIYYQPSGAIYQLTTLPGPLTAMYGYDNSHIMIFGNTFSGSPYIEQYNFSNNTFYSPMALPTAQILSVAQMNSNTYLVSFSNGNIYQFTYNPSSLVSFVNGVTSSCIRYDSIDNELIAGSATHVLEYNCTNASLISSATLSDTVRDVRVLFNK